MAFDPGSNLTSRNRLAQMLMQQEQAAPPIQAQSQGLASMLRQGLAGYMQGADVRDRAQAYETMIQGMQTKPWVNPNTGVTSDAQAGGLSGMQAALSRIPGNEAAQNFMPQLAMAQITREQDLQDFERQKQAQIDLAREKSKIELEQMDDPRYLAAKQAEVDRMIAMYGGRADAMRRTPEELAAEEAAKARGKALGEGAIAASKPLPTTALKMQNDLVEQVGLSEGINADMSSLSKMLEKGDIKLGLVDNLTAKAKLEMGVSDPQARNYQSFMNTLEKMRNDSLRLNSGVQTDGDAQRAWNELMAKTNDQEFVKQRLKEIEALNKRAVDLKRYQIDTIRQNYGKGPLEEMPTPSGAPGVGSGGGEYDYDPATGTLVPRGR